MTLAELPPTEIRRRVQMAASRTFDEGSMAAFRVGLMVGARAPEFGPQLEGYLAGLHDMPAEKLEHTVRALADVLTAPFEAPAEEGLGGA